MNQKSGGNLKGGVSNQKCAEDPTQDVCCRWQILCLSGCPQSIYSFGRDRRLRLEQIAKSPADIALATLVAIVSEVYSCQSFAPATDVCVGCSQSKVLSNCSSGSIAGFYRESQLKPVALVRYSRSCVNEVHPRQWCIRSTSW